MKFFSALNVFWMLTAATASAGQYTPDFTGARQADNPDFFSAVRNVSPAAAPSAPEIALPFTYPGTEAYNPNPGRDNSPGSYDAMDKNVFTNDNRRKVKNNTAYPWCAIGSLKVPKGNCTASLIGKDLILTNAHCVVDKATDSITDWNITFLPGYMDGKSAYSSGVIRAWWNKEKGDWAILRLAEPLGTTLGWLGVRALTDPMSTSLFAVGYSGDFDSGLSASWQDNCKLTSGPTSTGQFRHNCSNSRGASGSPLLRFEEQNGDKLPYIIALHAAEMRYPGDSTYQGVEYSDKTANLAEPGYRFAETVVEIPKLLAAEANKTPIGSRHDITDNRHP